MISSKRRVETLKEARIGTSAGEGPRTNQTHKRHRSRRQSTSPSGTGRVRAIYFILSGLWGFLLGWGALAVGLTLAGGEPQLSRIQVLAVTIGMLAATIGGVLILQRSYREYRRNRRGASGVS